MLEQLLARAVETNPEKIAIVYDKLRLTYADLYAKVIGLSREFNSIGIHQNECIALILPNCPEFVISFYAAARLNAVVLPLNHLFKEDEISYYISDSNAKAIVTDAKRANLCRNIISKLGREIELIVVDSTESSAINFYDLLHSETLGSQENPSISQGDLLYQYSSGSTGRPKRVNRTQENLYHEVQNFASTTAITSDDNILCLVPMYHAHGLGNCLLAATCNGATLVILEQFLGKDGTPTEIPFVFRRPRVLELIETEKITVFPAVPYIFNTLAETPADIKIDLSTIRLCFSAGNFLPKDVFDSFHQRFGVPIRQLYGCTEAGSVSINSDENPEQTWNSVGNPMKNVEIKIIDDQGNELPTGEIGEVVIESQALTSGYYNMPELNQQAFKDGGFLTGDLGKIDETGHVYITGRKKILIDTGGRKVDPIEIEDVLLTHTRIKEAVVVGVKGAHAGEIIKAVIVAEDLEQLVEQEIFVYCKQRLAEFKVPKIIEFRDEIPKSPLGKVLRKALV
jgi:long-chain acyl-CoA synthetase